jgi:hypothetical protein
VSSSTAKSLHVFNGQIAKFSEKTAIQLDVLIRRIAIEIYTRITLKTPVDTGRARASWNLSRGEPNLSVAPERAQLEDKVQWKGSALSGSQVPLRVITVQQQRASMSKRFVGQQAAKISALKGAKLVGKYNLATVWLVEPAWVTNNLFYVIYLEHGSSKQAPQGMVAITLTEVENNVRAALAA